MKSSAPLLSPILRSDTQGKMLAVLMMDSTAEYSLTELAQRSGVAVPTILRDVDRLMEGGFVTDRRIGRSRLVRIDTSHPIYESLWNVVMFGYGPAVVIPSLLQGAPGVERAFIFGSWAARYLGIGGVTPQDVDVLIVGGSEYGDFYELAQKATHLVGREVNVNIISSQRWKSQEDGFVKTIQSQALIELTLE